MESILISFLFLEIIIIAAFFIFKYSVMQVYLYFLFACILPSYFAFELTDSLPLLTASRILLLLFMLYAFSHKKQFSFRNIISEIGLMEVFEVYFICRIVATIVFLPSITSFALKELFTIVFEQFFVVYLIVRVVNNHKIFNNCINMMSYGAALVFGVGIFQSLSGINFSYYLNTVNREMLQTNALRLGFTRAEATFGHPVYFGEFCVMMMPILSYLYDLKKQWKYMLFLILDIVALMASNSRGAIIPGFLILFLLIESKKINDKWKCIIILGCCLVALYFVGLFFPVLNEVMVSIIKSILNVFGTSFDLNNYGGNVLGLESRVNQLTGIKWVFENRVPIFGFGPDAHTRGLVSYYINDRWNQLSTIDVGYVGFFLCEGFVGTIGHLILIFGLIYNSHKQTKKTKIGKMNKAFYLVFISYSILLLSAVGVDLLFWTMIGMYIAYNNIIKLDKTIGVRTINEQ